MPLIVNHWECLKQPSKDYNANGRRLGSNVVRVATVAASTPPATVAVLTPSGSYQVQVDPAITFADRSAAPWPLSAASSTHGVVISQEVLPTAAWSDCSMSVPCFVMFRCLKLLLQSFCSNQEFMSYSRLFTRNHGRWKRGVLMMWTVFAVLPPWWVSGGEPLQALILHGTDLKNIQVLSQTNQTWTKPKTTRPPQDETKACSILQHYAAWAQAAHRQRKCTKSSEEIQISPANAIQRGLTKSTQFQTRITSN